MIHVLCVATENKGYLEFLEASCKRYGLQLTKLKWGEPWKGYMDKIEAVITHLKTLPISDTVLFLDAYDTLVVKDPHELQKKITDDKIIVAVENVSGLSFSASATRFGTIDGELVNSGTYFGSVSALQTAFSIMEKMMPNYNDDQLLFTDLIRQQRSLFELDIRRELAAVCADKDMRSSVKVDPADLSVQFTFKGINSEPFVLHYTYDGDMCPTLESLHYDFDSLKHQQREHYQFKLFLHHARSVITAQWLLIFCCILFIILFIVCWVFFLQKKDKRPHVHWEL